MSKIRILQYSSVGSVVVTMNKIPILIYNRVTSVVVT
jgi:hypothetical protein